MGCPVAMQARPESRPAGVTWDLLSWDTAAGSPDTLARWEELLREFGTDQQMYQSPDWASFIAERAAPGERMVIAVARAGGAILGLAPLHVRRDSLRFAVAGRTLYRSQVLQVSVQGGRPLLPASAALHDGLFATLHAAFPRCDGVTLSTVLTGDFLWPYIRESEALRRMYLPHVVGGVRTSYRLPLPPSFRDHLAGLQRKRRYNLGREVRLLREYGQGSLAVVRIDSPPSVPGFLGTIEALARTAGRAWSWPGPGETRESAREWLGDLACRGLLCSYLLCCRDGPLAAILGYSHGDTCLIDSTVYSRPHARFSPGTVLLHLVVEDLIGRGVRLVNFGFGHPSYGSYPAVVAREGVSVVLLRRGLGNRLRRAAHSGFRDSAACLRRIAVGMGLWHDARGCPAH